MSDFEDLEESKCHGSRGLRNTGCVRSDHLYCATKTELRGGRCICQRWLRVDYYGCRAISAEQWKRFFATVLEGIECKFMGCDYNGCSDPRVPTRWFFFILLDKPLTRDEVIRRFYCKDLVSDVQRLRDLALLDFNGFSVDDLYPSLTCCYYQFIHFLSYWFDAMGAAFASHDDYMRNLVRFYLTHLRG